MAACQPGGLVLGARVCATQAWTSLTARSVSVILAAFSSQYPHSMKQEVTIEFFAMAKLEQFMPPVHFAVQKNARNPK
eukprot:4333835-Pyramimonas_sp.AAC.1